MKPKFYIMVGVPGSGKSTYARELANKDNCIIHSSDAIRIELNGNQADLSNDKNVWKTMNERILKDLSEGRNVICDATNVTIKKRASFINLINKIDCEKIAVVINTDVKKCISQNSKRDESARVPNFAIYSSAKHFVFPTEDEGFDKIIEINSKE